MKSPKKELDKDPIYVQIVKVTDDSYSFSAKIGFSKFKTDGTIYKVKIIRKFTFKLKKTQICKVYSCRIF